MAQGADDLSKRCQRMQERQMQGGHQAYGVQQRAVLLRWDTAQWCIMQVQQPSAGHALASHAAGSMLLFSP